MLVDIRTTLSTLNPIIIHKELSQNNNNSVVALSKFRVPLLEPISVTIGPFSESHTYLFDTALVNVLDRDLLSKLGGQIKFSSVERTLDGIWTNPQSLPCPPQLYFLFILKRKISTLYF